MQCGKEAFSVFGFHPAGTGSGMGVAEAEGGALWAVLYRLSWSTSSSGKHAGRETREFLCSSAEGAAWRVAWRWWTGPSVWRSHDDRFCQLGSHRPALDGIWISVARIPDPRLNGTGVRPWLIPCNKGEGGSRLYHKYRWIRSWRDLLRLARLTRSQIADGGEG